MKNLNKLMLSAALAVLAFGNNICMGSEALIEQFLRKEGPFNPNTGRSGCVDTYQNFESTLKSLESLGLGAPKSCKLSDEILKKLSYCARKDLDGVGREIENTLYAFRLLTARSHLASGFEINQPQEYFLSEDNLTTKLLVAFHDLLTEARLQGDENARHTDESSGNDDATKEFDETFAIAFGQERVLKGVLRSFFTENAAENLVTTLGRLAELCNSIVSPIFKELEQKNLKHELVD